MRPVAFWQDWTGGMGDQRPTRGAAGSGSGRIYGRRPDAPPGRPRTPLGIAKQTVHAVIRDGIAETEVDQTFSNPGGQAIEGWYWFTVPTDAIVTSFALETERPARRGRGHREARGGGAVRGRGARRRTIRRCSSGSTAAATARASSPSRRAARGASCSGTSSSSADGRGQAALRLPAALGRPGALRRVLALGRPRRRRRRSRASRRRSTRRVEPGGKLVTMRRSGYVPRADFQLEMTSAEAARRSARGASRPAPTRPTT